MASFNLESICRICLTNGSDLKYIFDSDNNISQLLMTCSSVKINKNDGLPTHICATCATHANHANIFKNLCETSDSKLRNFLVEGLSLSLLEGIKNDISNEFNSFFNQFSEEQHSELSEKFRVIKIKSPKLFVYECVLCNSQNYGSSKELVKHIKNNHMSDVEFVHFNCELCKRPFTTEFDLKRHLVIHKDYSTNGKNNTCPICKQIFIHHVHLLKHMGHHVEESVYGCSDCECFFTTGLYLKRHIKKMHKEDESISRGIIQKSTNELDDLKLKMDIESNIDVSIIKREQNFTDSFNSEPDVGNDFNDDFIISEIKSERVDVTPDIDVSESNCVKYKFDDAITENRDDQLEIKSKKKKKSKSFKIKLKKSSTTNNEKKTDPPVRFDLINNNNKKPSGERSYLCSVCGKGFLKSISLEKHMGSHLNENIKKTPLACPICGKLVNHSNHLRVHMRTHKDKNGQPLMPQEIDVNKEIILCSMCGKLCSSRSNLAVHMRRHLGVMTCICKICGKGYPRSTDLTLHMRRHTGERPFLCTYCNKDFARSDKLAIHVRIHTGEKPYSCQTCGRGFAQSNDLAAHKKRNNCFRTYNNHSNIRKMDIQIDSITDKPIDDKILPNENKKIDKVFADHSYHKTKLQKISKKKSIDAMTNTPSNISDDNSILNDHLMAHTKALEIATASVISNNLLVVDHANNKIVDFLNSDSITAKVISDIVKQNMIASDIISSQKALDLANENQSLFVPAQKLDFTNCPITSNITLPPNFTPSQSEFEI